MGAVVGAVVRAVAGAVVGAERRAQEQGRKEGGGRVKLSRSGGGGGLAWRLVGCPAVAVAMACRQGGRGSGVGRHTQIKCLTGGKQAGCDRRSSAASPEQAPARQPESCRQRWTQPEPRRWRQRHRRQRPLPGPGRLQGGHGVRGGYCDQIRQSLQPAARVHGALPPAPAAAPASACRPARPQAALTGGGGPVVALGDFLGSSRGVATLQSGSQRRGRRAGLGLHQATVGACRGGSRGGAGRQGFGWGQRVGLCY